MKNITVLGCGRVGRTICEDLSANFDVSVVDISIKNLEKLNTKKVKRTLTFVIKVN